jgi:ABC-type transport system involved in cytochrome c biogenesis permease subunit
VRHAARWWLTVGLTALAWAVQTVYLLNLALENRRAPITTVFESLIALSWIVGAVGLYLMVHAPRPVAVGAFVLPIVTALAAVAGVAAPRRADWGEAWHGSTAFWGSVHGMFLLAGAASTTVAFTAALMYLAQARRLKHKRPGPNRFGFALPSLERSERLNRAAVTIAFPLLTFGLLIGAALSFAARGSSGRAVVPWTDPKVVSAMAMWVVFAALLHARFRPALRGRAVVLLTILAFAFLVFTWVGVDALRLPTRHGVASAAPAAGRAP